MDNLLDSLSEKLGKMFIEKFSLYIVKVSEMKGLFNVVMRKPREKTLNEDHVSMFDSVKNLSEKIYSVHLCISTPFLI